MAAVAIVDRFVSNKIKKNSLAVVDRYHFDDARTATEFAAGLKRLDGRVIGYTIKEIA